MKKIINDPNCVVDEMLKGIEISNPDVFYGTWCTADY